MHDGWYSRNMATPAGYNVRSSSVLSALEIAGEAYLGLTSTTPHHYVRWRK